MSPIAIGSKIAQMGGYSTSFNLGISKISTSAILGSGLLSAAKLTGYAGVTAEDKSWTGKARNILNAGTAVAVVSNAVVPCALTTAMVTAALALGAIANIGSGIKQIRNGWESSKKKNWREVSEGIVSTGLGAIQLHAFFREMVSEKEFQSPIKKSDEPPSQDKQSAVLEQCPVEEFPTQQQAKMSYNATYPESFSQLKNTHHISTSQKEDIPDFLKWTDRPKDVQECVDRSFNSLARDTNSVWGYNGIYPGPNGICRVNEYHLIKKIIQQSTDGRKDFYALDIGSGNFGWIKGFSDYINSQTDLPKDVTVHLIGTRGEKFDGPALTTEGRTKIYRLGGFKIEELTKAFPQHHLDLMNKIDVITSRWSFRHFCDPVGTFIQTYNFLRPKTGVLMTDGFFFKTPSTTPETYTEQMIDLFSATKAPFVLRYYSEGRSLDHFLLQRPDELPMQLSIKYAGITGIGREYQINSHSITGFDRDLQDLSMPNVSIKQMEGDFHTNNPDFYNQLVGDKILCPKLSCR